MSTTPKQHWLDPACEAERAAWLARRGEPPYRARQIRGWLFERRAANFAAMTDLPSALRADLAAQFDVWTTKIVAHQQSADGTEKLLLELADGQCIECVLLRDGERRTICISTQVGCAMGCTFCASGIDGVVRDLTSGEIIEQMLRLSALLPVQERLSHVVVMGMGEPLANLDRLLPALDEATSSTGLAISARRVTISTVGLPAGIRRLARHGRQYHLAVSLHAASDELRNDIVRVNRNIGLDAVLHAADDYFAATGRRVTFEYVLLDGVNDRSLDARQLAARLRGWTAMVNVIPYNPVAGLPYATPSPEHIERFLGILRTGGINAQLRERKGDDIDAACGQLRRNRSRAVATGR